MKMTSGDGFGRTTVTEFLFRHAGMPLSLNRVTAVLGFVQTFIYNSLEATQPVLLKGIPNHERRNGAAGACQGRIQDADVLDGACDARNVLAPGESDAAGQR